MADDSTEKAAATAAGPSTGALNYLSVMGDPNNEIEVARKQLEEAYNARAAGAAGNAWTGFAAGAQAPSSTTTSGKGLGWLANAFAGYDKGNQQYLAERERAATMRYEFAKERARDAYIRKYGPGYQQMFDAEMATGNAGTQNPAPQAAGAPQAAAAPQGAPQPAGAPVAPPQAPQQASAPAPAANPSDPDGIWSSGGQTPAQPTGLPSAPASPQSAPSQQPQPQGVSGPAGVQQGQTPQNERAQQATPKAPMDVYNNWMRRGMILGMAKDMGIPGAATMAELHKATKPNFQMHDGWFYDTASATMQDMHEVQYVDGVPVDKHSGRLRTDLPTMMKVLPNGQAIQPLYLGNNEWGVRVPDGSTVAFAQFEGIRKLIEALGTPQKTVGPDNMEHWDSTAHILNLGRELGGVVRKAAGLPPDGGGQGPLTSRGNSGGGGAVAGRDPQQQQAREKEGTDLAANMAAVRDSARTAPSNIQMVSHLVNLLDRYDGGKFSGTGVEIASALNSIPGGNTLLKMTGLSERVGNAQAAEALSNQLVLQLKNIGGSNALPGSLSDADRMFLERMAPSLGQTREGRQLVAEAMRRVYQRQQQVYADAVAWRKQNGDRVPDDNFWFEEAARLSKINMFAGMTQPAGQPGRTAPLPKNGRYGNSTPPGAAAGSAATTPKQPVVKSDL